MNFRNFVKNIKNYIQILFCNNLRVMRNYIRKIHHSSAKTLLILNNQKKMKFHSLRDTL